MTARHRARGLVRSITVPLLAVVTVAGVLVGVSSSAGASPSVVGGCTSRVAGLNAPNPITVAQANPQFSPCVFDRVSLADLNVTLVPGIPPLSGVNAQVHAVVSSTSFTDFGVVASTEAQTDAGRVQIIAPGLFLTATGVHSQAGVVLNSECGGAANGDSWLGSLTINGHVIQLGNGPLTIPVGLRIVVYVNQQLHPSSHDVTQRALFIQFSDKRYSLVVGEAHAALACIG